MSLPFSYYSMDLFLNHFSEEPYRKSLDRVNAVPFSLFQDRLPTLDELGRNEINIYSHQEPDEYTGAQTWVLRNHGLFSLILTWDDRLLRQCPQAVYLPFGHTWLTPEQISKSRTKIFEVAHLAGKQKLTYGHAMRHEILTRSEELTVPLRFYHTIGSRYDIADARLGKEHVFGEPQFGIAIENTSHNGYFTEKILDCFLMRTVPLYWGCSNIERFFDREGIIRFENVDQLIDTVNSLTPESYYSYLPAVERNFQLAQRYVDYLGNIAARVEQIFALNGLLPNVKV